MEITIILSQENKTLPKSELIARLEVLDIKYEILNEYPGVIELKVDSNREMIKELGSHLGYTHEIHENITYTTPEDVFNSIRSINWNEIIDGSFKVRVRRVGTGPVDKNNIERIVGGKIQKNTQQPVKLDNPDYTIKLIYTDPEIIVNDKKEEIITRYNKVIVSKCIVIQNKKHFFDNKPHKRPYFHPGSMSPKLALCMVNLARVHKKDTVLDPFCGTGGILIEAGCLDTKIIGSDIERNMVEGTKLNLSHEGFKDYTVYWEDVRKLDFKQKVDAVAMDPPYGISTTLGGDNTKELYHEALISIAKHLKDDGYICMASPHYIDLYEVIEDTPLKILEQHSIKMHKSLTRIITVLKKK